MPGDNEPLVDPTDGEPRPSRRSRRPLLVAAIGLVCLLALGGGLFAVLRSDGDESEGVITEVTFGPEGNATSIPERPANYGPILQLDLDRGPPGTEVTLQGATFRADEEVRRIELYWDRVGGPKLGTVDAPRFSVKVKIPADAPVLNEGHNIIAVQRDKDGKVVTTDSVPFFVI